MRNFLGLKRIARKPETVEKLRKLRSICESNMIELVYDPQQIESMKQRAEGWKE